MKVSLSRSQLIEDHKTMRYLIYLWLTCIMRESEEKNYGDKSIPYGFPVFTHEARNATVKEGQEVTLTCSVSSLLGYKLAWVHEDSQSILSIGRHLYTNSKRLTLAVDKRTVAITISPVIASDRGWYMCQLNTDPMTSSRSFLQVLVPPTLKEWSGPELEAREGSEIELICKSRSYPQAVTRWRRTDGEPIFNEEDGKIVWVVEGEVLSFPSLRRKHSATYSCHIDNEETPSLSRETHVIVTYPPMVWIENELVGASENEDVTIACTSDANPLPQHSWLRNRTEIKNGRKFRVWDEVSNSIWKSLLTIRSLQFEDFTRYSCSAINPIGQAEGSISIYEIREQIMVPPTLPNKFSKDFLPKSQGIPLEVPITSTKESELFSTTTERPRRKLERNMTSFYLEIPIFGSCASVYMLPSSFSLSYSVICYFMFHILTNI